MDWQKSKTTLIVSLIITNLILFVLVLINFTGSLDQSLSPKSIENTKKILEDYDIEIACAIPKRHPKLPSLLVEFESYDEDSLKRRFFNNAGTITHPSTDRVEINWNDEHINLFNYRRIFYEYSGSKEKYELEDKKDAEKIVNDFLVSHKYRIDDMNLNYYTEEEGKCYLNYTKIYEGKILESSYTNFVVDKRGVLSMDRLWLNVLEKSKKKTTLSSATRALLGLVDKEEAYGKKIISIKDCFYFNPEDQGYIEDITKALQGRAIASWRIEFEDGDNIVMDEY